MTSKTTQLVCRLLEVDPKKFILRQPTPPLDAKTKQFQQEVIAYVKWVRPDYFPEDIELVKKAKTFEEIQRVLVQYEEPESPFLEFVQTYCR